MTLHPVPHAEGWAEWTRGVSPGLGIRKRHPEAGAYWLHDQAVSEAALSHDPYKVSHQLPCSALWVLIIDSWSSL